MVSNIYALLFILLLLLQNSPAVSAKADVVSFRSGEITLKGTLYKPSGKGPFPPVILQPRQRSRHVEPAGI